MEQTCKTPLEDLRKNDLGHYDEASTKIHNYTNSVPRAINFWYDYQQMSRWKKFLLVFK